MNSRLIYTLANNIDDIKESSFIDCYNNIIREDIAGAIKTTIDTANMSYVIVKDNRDMNEVVNTNVVGELTEGIWAKREQTRRVYGTDGIAPTLQTCQGGGREPKIEVLGWTRDKNGKVTDRHPVDVANCITSNKGSNMQNYVRETITYRGKEFKEGDGLYLFDSEKFASGGLDGISRTLKAEKDDAAVCVREFITYKSEYNGKTEIFKEYNERNTREILRILWKEIGTETFLGEIGGLVSVQEAEVLQQGMYEKSIHKERCRYTEIQTCAPVSETDSIDDKRCGDEMRDLWKCEESGCSSQRQELSQQFIREFNDCLSKLSCKTPQTEECVRYLRKADERWTWLLQQTLLTLQEVRKSANEQRKVNGRLRIRKLTEREAFRLMGCDDADIDKIQSAGISKTQQYKMAGNSIVVDVLYHIFRKMFVETKPEGGTQLELF
jgi:hypothetical protein